MAIPIDANVSDVRSHARNVLSIYTSLLVYKNKFIFFFFFFFFFLQMYFSLTQCEMIPSNTALIFQFQATIPIRDPCEP